jgi:hypothetical protein
MLYECRCNERLQTKTNEFTRLAYTSFLESYQKRKGKAAGKKKEKEKEKEKRKVEANGRGALVSVDFSDLGQRACFT